METAFPLIWVTGAEEEGDADSASNQASVMSESKKPSSSMIGCHSACLRSHSLLHSAIALIGPTGFKENMQSMRDAMMAFERLEDMLQAFQNAYPDYTPLPIDPPSLHHLPLRSCSLPASAHSAPTSNSSHDTNTNITATITFGTPTAAPMPIPRRAASHRQRSSSSGSSVAAPATPPMATSAMATSASSAYLVSPSPAQSSLPSSCINGLPWEGQQRQHQHRNRGLSCSSSQSDGHVSFGFDIVPSRSNSTGSAPSSGRSSLDQSSGEPPCSQSTSSPGGNKAINMDIITDLMDIITPGIPPPSHQSDSNDQDCNNNNNCNNYNNDTSSCQLLSSSPPTAPRTPPHNLLENSIQEEPMAVDGWYGYYPLEEDTDTTPRPIEEDTHITPRPEPAQQDLQGSATQGLPVGVTAQVWMTPRAERDTAMQTALEHQSTVLTPVKMQAFQTSNLGSLTVSSTEEVQKASEVLGPQGEPHLEELLSPNRVLPLRTSGISNSALKASSPRHERKRSGGAGTGLSTHSHQRKRSFGGSSNKSSASSKSSTKCGSRTQTGSSTRVSSRAQSGLHTRTCSNDLAAMASALMHELQMQRKA